jgi:enamine deaminase RidA (YjgF/YER057c/UK114 family)
VLAGAGFEFADIVKFTTYLVRAEDVEAYRTARGPLFDRYFPDRRFPASTLVVVSQLAIQELLIEVEAVAARAR